MNFKIDTKEKFTTITAACENFSDNVAAELQTITQQILQQEVKNVIVKLDAVRDVDSTAAETLVKLQQSFYEQNASFVICCLTKNVEQFFEDQELLEIMNVTPTESEAWDIVQMEEIERELLDSDDVEFDVQDES